MTRGEIERVARPGEPHRNARRPVLVVDGAPPTRPSLHAEICLPTNHEDRPAADPVRRSFTTSDAPDATPGRSLRDRVRERNGVEDILLFRVADERFGLALTAVEEAIDLPPVFHVPEMSSAMLGVITVRGTLTSVFSPAAALGLTLHDGASALIFRRGRSRVAIVVDEVDDVTSLDLALLRDAPALHAGDGIVLGVVRQRDAILAIVDADALLDACQAVPLLETA